MSLEDDIRELKDRTAIKEAVFRYCRYADTQDIDGMVSMFTEDCFDHGDEAHISRSRQELHDWLNSVLKGVVTTGSHYVTNVEIIFDTPDSATFYSYLYSMQRWADHPMMADLHRWGRYEIRAVRQNGEWKLSHMTLISALEYAGPRAGEHLGRPWPPEFS